MLSGDVGWAMELDCFSLIEPKGKCTPANICIAPMSACSRHCCLFKTGLGSGSISAPRAGGMRSGCECIPAVWTAGKVLGFLAHLKNDVFDTILAIALSQVH